jgi:plasmid stabilization system protein ParE
MMIAIDWSDRADLDLDNLLDRLEVASSHPIFAANFVEGLIYKTEAALSSGIATYRKGKIKGTFEYVVHDNYIVIYREYPKAKRIEILALWDVRQNPKRLSQHLKP